MSAVLLEARGVAKRFGFREILQDIDLMLENGSICAVFGPNGAGKSTLLKIMALLTRPSAGRLLWEGRPVGQDGAGYRSVLGMVGHGTYLYDNLNAEENLLFYGRLYRVPDPRRRAAEMLDRVGLAFASQDPVGAFSRGMKQRLTIARALLHRPRVLLMDEPFTGLDQAGRGLLLELLREFRHGGGACLLISHDFAETLDVADRFVILAGGRIVSRGETGKTGPDRFARLYEETVGRPLRDEAE